MPASNFSFRLRNVYCLPAILLAVAGVVSPVWAQGVPYRSPFDDDYQFRTNSLLSTVPPTVHASVIAAPARSSFVEMSLLDRRPVVARRHGHSMVLSGRSISSASKSGRATFQAPSVIQQDTMPWLSQRFTVSGQEASNDPVMPGCGDEGCSAANDGGCGEYFLSPCDETGRRWMFGLHSVFLYRYELKSQTLFQNPALTSQRLDASDFEFESRDGIEMSALWYDPRAEIDYEFRALWQDQWTDSASASLTGANVSFLSNPVQTIAGPRNITAAFSSRTGSFEVNARHRIGRGSSHWTVVGGFRHWMLKESIDVSLVDPGGILAAETVGIHADNRLYGVQFGTDYVSSVSHRLCLRMFNRVGIYGNVIDNSLTLSSAGTSGGSDAEITIHGELGVSAAFRLTPWLQATLGARTIYLDGMALASEQPVPRILRLRSASTATALCCCTQPRPGSNSFIEPKRNRSRFLSAVWGRPVLC